jgi:hypothetical protein
MPRQGRKSLLESNLQFWLENKLLEEGLYHNIDTGQTDPYGRDLSRLISVSADEGFQDGQVWQSAFKNWVYESGIVPTYSGVAPPTSVSGVTVDGTFYPSSTSGAFEHSVDFPNGRVIFTNPLALASDVQASFAYKEVTVDFAERFDNERMDLLFETAIKDNPQQSGVQAYPDKDNRTLPAIWIDVRRRENDGYELGSKSLVSDFFGVLHVWARDRWLRNMVEDVLNEMHRDVLLGIDFNDAPFPLLSRGRRNPVWTKYSDYARVGSPYFWRRIYLDEIGSTKDKPLFEVERTRVTFQARIYPNF